MKTTIKDQKLSQDDQQLISKTQAKQQMQEIRQYAIKLTELKTEVIKKLPLNDKLIHALLESKNITNFNATKRHISFIAKLLSNYDAVEIINIIDSNNPNSKLSQQKIMWQNKWLEYLISQQRIATTKFIKEYPDIDAQQLNNLVRNAKANADGVISKTAETKLRKYLHKFFQKYPLNNPPL
jgi:ribosome-associated protein